MKVFSTIIITLLVLIGAVLAFIYSGVFNVAATEQDTGLIHWALTTTRERSIESRAENIKVPPLTDAMAQAGRNYFGKTCVMCHGAPGVDPGEIGKGLNPQPPYLAAEGAQWDPTEVFWVLQHGIKMTGMPAFGPTHSEDELWNLVAFVQKLPGMTAQTYQAMGQSADSESSEQEKRSSALTQWAAQGSPRSSLTH